MKKIKAKTIGGFSVSNLNQNVRPQDDFFEYAIGGWIKQNPIPKEKAAWGTFYKLVDDVLGDLHSLILKTTKKRSRKGTPEQQVCDLYLSGKNTKLRNELGFSPLESTFSKIDTIETRDDILSFVTESHNAGNSLLWATGVGADDKRSDFNTVFMWQAGLTLPDREYYLKDDLASKAIRKKYLKHMENMFSMSCWKRSDAKQMANDVLLLETKLARISMDKVSARDIDKIYNKMTLPKLRRLFPKFNWSEYFTNIELKNVREVVVGQPNYLGKLAQPLRVEDIEIWKAYLYWQTITDAAPYLSTAAEKENFAFFGKILAGKKKMEPQWKRLTSVVNGVLTDVIGRQYVKSYFPKKAKVEMDELVRNLFLAYRGRIKKLDWMSIKTKKKALRKLSQMTPKIGYPRKWKIYRGLLVKANDYYGNLMRATLYEKKRNYRKLHKKVDRTEWHLGPQTVNAYYYPNTNDIVFPAGVLQPPFFDFRSDAAYNYGSIGAVIGHEMTHGFDDQGARFNGRGTLENWWTKKDLELFKKKSKVLVRQFNQLKVGDLNVNGKLTLGENIADLGGIVLAYDAYQRYLKRHGRHDISGITPEQRFFLGAALFDAGHYTKELARMRVLTDPHSPAKYRVNVPLSNLAEFHKAYTLSSKDKMYRTPKSRAKIW